MRAHVFAVLLGVICVLSAAGTHAEVPILAPDPEECEACTVVNLSQRTRFPERGSPFEEWVLWCEGCRGAYPQWTLQATFECRPWNQVQFLMRSRQTCFWSCPALVDSVPLDAHAVCLTVVVIPDPCVQLTLHRRVPPSPRQRSLPSGTSVRTPPGFRTPTRSAVGAGCTTPR